jgi:hypothetical protein
MYGCLGTSWDGCDLSSQEFFPGFTQAAHALLDFFWRVNRKIETHSVFKRAAGRES